MIWYFFTIRLTTFGKNILYHSKGKSIYKSIQKKKKLKLLFKTTLTFRILHVVSKSVVILSTNTQSNKHRLQPTLTPICLPKIKGVLRGPQGHSDLVNRRRWICQLLLFCLQVNYSQE